MPDNNRFLKNDIGQSVVQNHIRYHNHMLETEWPELLFHKLKSVISKPLDKFPII